MPIPAGAGSPGGLPEWAPLRENVADYVPHRTLKQQPSTTTGSADVYYLTFDVDTRPTGWAVDRLIADGIAWVISRVTPLHTTSHDTARLVATLYAAAAVERSWPHDDQSLQRANDMERRMESLLAGLVVSNDEANGGGGSGGDNLMPLWSFPSAPSWGDALL
ncbi:hypothetical protein [Micromonospora sediminicola]|uniref:hypothetical protein n=1 Tax=Micromonospora sediminicola TaxID=946078 RepID=UPI0037A053EC